MIFIKTYAAVLGIVMLTDRETNRQRDKQTERQTDRETNRQRDKQTERQTDRETNRQRDKHDRH